jgi:coenzyme PQQ precursor peptide PqqA
MSIADLYGGNALASQCSNSAGLLPRSGKISLANFSARINLASGRIRPNSQKWRAKMAWKAPKIVEVPCGMEINMYVSATRK